MTFLKISGVLLVASALVGGSAAAVVPVTGAHLTLTPFAGAIDWSSDIQLKNHAIFGGRLGLALAPGFTLEGHLGTISSPLILPANDVQDVPSDYSVLNFGGDLLVNLVPSSAPVIPYALAGFQAANFKPKAPQYDRVYRHGAEVALGVKVPVSSRISLRFEGRDVTWSHALNDPVEVKGVTRATQSQIYTGGIEFAILGSVVEPDEDGDGVPDKLDKCPHTLHGARVDANGCPIDSDGDGVPDGIDQCPDTPHGAVVDAVGCPIDSDGDGVSDGIDKCPNTPKGCQVDGTGCPIDSDGDGVCDGVDKCPNTPKGCVVDATGCPTDSDGDGVCDGLDKCPDTPAGARVDKDGCPIVVSDKEVELLDTGSITVQNIHFATGKADNPPDAAPILDEIGNILVKWPQLRIEIGGHTDATGSAKLNQDLSQKRAQSVLDYLLQKFPQINREQFTAVGYGPSQPVATNDTPEGRAMNRRVVFKVLNTEVLRREKEQRRILQKGE